MDTENTRIRNAFDGVDYQSLQPYKKELDKIFYGNEFLMKSFPRFYKKVTSMRFDIPYSVLKFYYDNQAIIQIFSPHENIDYSHTPILCYAPFEKVYVINAVVIYVQHHFQSIELIIVMVIVKTIVR